MLPSYLQAIESAGGEPVVIPLGLAPAEIARLITSCSAVLLPGSKADVDPQKFGAKRHPQTAPADPLRDTADELLLQDAYNMHKPVLAMGVDGWWPDEGDALNLPSRLVRNRFYWDAYQKDRPNERPFALHRNGAPGWYYDDLFVCEGRAAGKRVFAWRGRAVAQTEGVA